MPGIRWNCAERATKLSLTYPNARADDQQMRQEKSGTRSSLPRRLAMSACRPRCLALRHDGYRWMLLHSTIDLISTVYRSEAVLCQPAGPEIRDSIDGLPQPETYRVAIHSGVINMIPSLAGKTGGAA